MNKEALEKEILNANIAYSSGIPFMSDEEWVEISRIIKE